MLSLSLTAPENDAVADLSCAQCGAPLPAERVYEHFCSERCQRLMDAYIVARIRARPELIGRPYARPA